MILSGTLPLLLRSLHRSMDYTRWYGIHLNDATKLTMTNAKCCFLLILSVPDVEPDSVAAEDLNRYCWFYGSSRLVLP